MKIYVVDNYDSFVYNIIHLLKELGADEIKVVKNDEIDFNVTEGYDKILLSPGPGIPEEAGKMMELIEQCYSSHNMLGVCLGHQGIGQYFGWQLKQLAVPLHGVASSMTVLDDRCLLKDVPSGTTIGHYHSWILEQQNSSPLKILATDEAGNIMAFRHNDYKVFGVQFHPESVLTMSGKIILKNWLNT